MSHTLLLEIGVEELPARFVAPGVEQLQQKTVKWLTDSRLAYHSIRTYSTPRRLAVIVEGLASRQDDIREEIKGPAKKIAQDEHGQWSKAALGFARSQGVEPEQLFFRELNHVEYVFALKESKGRSAGELLPSALSELVLSLHFPKNMRWGTHDVRYARPIRKLLALLDEQVIPFEIAGVRADRVTFGHRFLGADVVVAHAAEYEARLKEQFVFADADERSALIVGQIEALADAHGWQVPIDEQLLAEVTALVEYPTALFGTFSEEFLHIPQEVLITSMREHQRYFPVLDADGKMLPFFITVRNGDRRSLEQVAKGNEKVLRARLADARFFYLEDQKMTIEQALGKLEKIVYQEELGTIADKVRRIVGTVRSLSERLGWDEQSSGPAVRAAEICKFDLVSQMVYEFPELQGVMGEDYALKLGEQPAVARAIKEHYYPRFSGDGSATEAVGAVVGMADKLDTLVGCFSLGLIPTGSQDPYALRRQAAGIVQTILDHRLECTLSQLIASACASYGTARPQATDERQLHSQVMEFFALRIKNLLTERGVRYDVVDAVMSVGFDDVQAVVHRADALMNWLGRAGATCKLTCDALTRVVNIAAKQAATAAVVDPQKFIHPSEQQLFAAWSGSADDYRRACTQRQFGTCLALFDALESAITEFFTHVMVMVEDEALRDNRLALLQRLAADIRLFADFGKLVW